MAVVGHLEKMGRELKCPICLSLLKSSVSLGCNHVFCNSCILESMKSASDCPVCKVPFRRREVRAAPHMDNLVGIYKTMEVASGVNIFTTQAALSVKKSEDGQARVNGENATAPETKIARPRKSNGEGSSCIQNKKEKAHVRSLAKKRIHVAPYPVSETPMRPEKVSKSGNPSNELATNIVIDKNERLAADKPGDPLFSPFFWMREENDEDEFPEKPNSQQTQCASPPHNAPCFSDLKDSEDDATPTKMTPISKPNAADAFDSEMFEWTQRTCSPELCSTPMKKQTAGKRRLDGMLGKDVASGNEVPSSECAKSSNVTQSNVNAEPNSTVDVRRRNHKKTKKTPNCKVQTKHVDASVGRANGSSVDKVHPQVLVDSRATPKSSNQEIADTEQNTPQRPGTKDNRSNKTTSHHLRKHVKNPMNQFADTAMAEAVDKMGPDMRIRSGKRGKRVMLLSQRKRMKTSMDDSLDNTVKEVPAILVNEANIQDQEYQKVNVNLRVLSSNHSENKEPSSNGQSRRCKEIQKKSRELKELRLDGTAVVAVTKDADKMPLTSIQTAEREHNQIATSCKKIDSFATKSSTKTKESILTSGANVLRKCETIISQIRCAFCQSSNDTEVSGEMMHYFNGKPIAADYNGGINVIHSHKNCTEWAPDVYFEDDLVINLPSELARSRRIKCSCCGIKGAGLGCYEKSCRRSFHFTCAKLMPECRWDNENFVMLCPLHLSSKLPCETSKPHRQTRKRSTSEAEFQASFIHKPGPDTSRKWTWPSRSPCKWVICCSALTIAEKEIVSKLSRFAGISILKAWTPAVTHVIASTDVNGACRRTLKFLMGILDGKWILSIDWIKACMKVMEPVDEEKFEITLDIHGITGGPRQGRLRIINKQPKLFEGFRFYFTGDFQTSYKGYLQDLVIAAGGVVLQRKPISRVQEKLLDDSPTLETLIIYSLEIPENHKQSHDATALNCRRTAQDLADACGAQVVGNPWILDSIAACKLQPLA